MYYPERQFLSPHEWRSRGGLKGQDYGVFITDTCGHFVTTLVVPCEGRAIVYNTMQGNVLASPIFTFLKDLLLVGGGGQVRVPPPSVEGESPR